MRQKLLDCIRAYIGIGNVEGIVELDETLVAESFKGNHKKSGFVMPRPARQRGGEAHTRGISHEQVCIASAIDRHGNIILESVCKGRIRHAIWKSYLLVILRKIVLSVQIAINRIFSSLKTFLSCTSR